MTQDKEKLIAELVNKGLDGDMDSVNACEDRIIRGKAKAMIAKVNKSVVPVSEHRKSVINSVQICSLSRNLVTKYQPRAVCVLIEVGNKEK